MDISGIGSKIDAIRSKNLQSEDISLGFLTLNLVALAICILANQLFAAAVVCANSVRFAYHWIQTKSTQGLEIQVHNLEIQVDRMTTQVDRFADENERYAGNTSEHAQNNRDQAESLETLQKLVAHASQVLQQQNPPDSLASGSVSALQITDK